MPYIKPEDRPRLDALIQELSQKIDNEGELNYTITSLLHNFTLKQGKCYATMNKVQGVMSCASMEYYRTVVGPYEDLKIAQNGNVGELDKDFLSKTEKNDPNKY